uniref:DUF834 domain-containing protein n=1 Tax=Oryza meridionalis TaxID=40149 RepID=A0A0E0E593_9ORYZ
MAASLVGEADGLTVLLTPRGGGRGGRRLDGALDAGVGLDSVEKRPAAARIWPAVEEAVAASVETGEEASAAEAGQCGRREDGGGEGEVERRRAAQIWGCRWRGEVVGGADPRGRRRGGAAKGWGGGEEAVVRGRRRGG